MCLTCSRRTLNIHVLNGGVTAGGAGGADCPPRRFSAGNLKIRREKWKERKEERKGKGERERKKRKGKKKGKRREKGKEGRGKERRRGKGREKGKERVESAGIGRSSSAFFIFSRSTSF